MGFAYQQLKIYESPRTIKGKEIDSAADSVFKDYSAELVPVNRNGEDEQEVIAKLSCEILNEWNFENNFKSNRSESSERTVTRSYGREECDESKLIILKEVGVESEDAKEMSGSLEKNEFVCSAGEGTVQAMNVRSHDK
ncbi:hypothetical protein PIB30_024507 [Stylosanthes scabra]|uniref:Uncharacterized protein n=1 Tax=Stylosanthes scabra TaxID=79078 RepID=A0ABU6Z8B6_9FABA|nr:hypothetical protein [Stylosanthes scabra]